jgi:hypothetical protein
MRKEMGWSLDDLYNIDVHDPSVIAGLPQNDVIGIFQFEGPACRYVNGALQPDNFKQVYDVTALGGLVRYTTVPRTTTSTSSTAALSTNLCTRRWTTSASTYGQVVYQEQILRILGEIGGFDHTHRAEVRRIISKKIGEQEFNRRWGRFRDGAELQPTPDGRGDSAPHLDALHHRGLLRLQRCARGSVRHDRESRHVVQAVRADALLQGMLNISDDERQRTLLRDTQRKGRKLKITRRTRVQRRHWERERRAGRGLLAGPGIGDKPARRSWSTARSIRRRSQTGRI